MKTTLHPQLLAVLGISAGIFLLQSRGFADVPISALKDVDLQAPIVVALAPVRTVIPRRDPFVASVDEIAPSPKQPDFDGMLAASNTKATSGEQKTDGQSGLHLRAVVLGTRRYALVADGSSSQIVTIGSRLAGSVVNDISLRGITLANGARFIPEETGK